MNEHDQSPASTKQVILKDLPFTRKEPTSNLSQPLTCGDLNEDFGDIAEALAFYSPTLSLSSVKLFPLAVKCDVIEIEDLLPEKTAAWTSAVGSF